MRITKILAVNVKFNIPNKEAYGMSRGLANSRGSTIVIVETDVGLTGFGEAWGSGPHMVKFIQDLAEFFVGKDPFDRQILLQELLDKMYHMGRAGIHVSALSGIDIALWDLIGKATKQPVSKLLGGKQRQRIMAYASTGYFTETNQKENLKPQLEEAYSKGYKAYKIKIGASPQSDVERVSIVKDIIGDDSLLIVDANGNYKREGAVQSAKRLEDFKIHWFEEPISPEDLEGFAYLKSKTTIPLASGEALFTRHGFKYYFTRGLIDVAQPDLSKCGGISEAQAILNLAQTFNLSVSTHVWGSAVGFAASLQFMGYLPSHPHTINETDPALFEFDQAKNPLIYELTNETIELKDGYIEIPDEPGLGMSFDEEKLKEFAKKDKTLLLG